MSFETQKSIIMILSELEPQKIHSNGIQIGKD